MVVCARVLQALSEQLPALRSFWARLSTAERAALSTERSDILLKVLHLAASNPQVTPQRPVGGSMRCKAGHARWSAVGIVLQGIVKHFFNDKEVTSTLVMDALFGGYWQREEGAAHLNVRQCS